MPFRLLFRSLNFLALVFATISLVCFGVQEKIKLEKIAVSVFRCFGVSWFSNAPDTWAMLNKSNHSPNPLSMSASKDFCIHKVEAMVWWRRNFCYITNILLACIKQQLSVFPVFIVVKKEIQSNLDYPDLDYPDFSIIRTFFLVPIWL